jgi:transcriptional regulator with XRE-family HTH domain
VNQNTLTPNDRDDASLFDEGDDWATFLKKQMTALGWDNLDLAEATGIDRSQVSRWLNREGRPSPRSIRKVCAALKVDIRYGIVANGDYTAEEMRLHTRLSVRREVLRSAAPEELTAELLSRITPANGVQERLAASNGVVKGEYTEQRRPVVSDPFSLHADGQAS